MESEKLPSEKLLGEIGLEIAGMTARVEAGNILDEALPSANDKARKLGLKLDTIKKKLRVLKAAELVQAVSYSPKRYRFNRYILRDMTEESEFYALFCESESPYFIGL